MSLRASFEKYTLEFKFRAGTSRGILTDREIYLLTLWDTENPEIKGVGEAGPLKGLSPDFEQVERKMAGLCEALESIEVPQSKDDIYNLIDSLLSCEFPSIRFALETALLDLVQGGVRSIFEPKATLNKHGLPINGLIWMGSYDFMKEQIDRKIGEGFTCLKLKIGALDFDQECALLNYIRTEYHSEITLRVDANGAFHKHEAQFQLKELSKYNIHSIEQPVEAGQWEVMSKLCISPLIPIALDEELIGITEPSTQHDLLDSIAPQYIILKPTLLGGLKETGKWIKMAESKNIGWWLTSALESNIGLNALAQFTSTLPIQIPQGLGTGQLYKNNLPGDLKISRGYLFLNP